VHYFAKFENNLIIEILNVSNQDCNNQTYPASEPIGQAFLNSLGLEGLWLETSLTGEFRQRYAFITGTFNDELDAFINPQPYPSWILDNTGAWIAPVPYPSDVPPKDIYVWDENTQSWKFELGVEQ
jgi:hypothetical protein